MINAVRKILMKREAVLFDTPLFILKTFFAVMVGYAIFHKNPLIGKDMISVLLGLMLTLQPVNISGLKSAWDQLSASLIGGVVTGIIVIIGGVNFITVPLAVAITLYITLRINWRSMSVIAVFTSIYMTQYIQINAAGDPSMFLTFRLRLLALGAGILIALIINLIFSLLFYKSIVRKRTLYIIEKISDSLESLINLVGKGTDVEFEVLEKQIILLFGDIDAILGGLMDIRLKTTASGKPSVFVEKVKEMRGINHYLLDMAMQERTEHIYKFYLPELKKIQKSLEDLGNRIDNKTEAQWEPCDCNTDDKSIIRVCNSFIKISKLNH